MAFLIQATFDAIRDALLKTNYFSTVEIGEPKSPPADAKLTVHIWIESISEVATTLDKTIEVYTLTMRMMIPTVFSEPVEGIEVELAEAVSRADEGLFADFSFGATVRNIDVVGQYGTAYRVDFGHVDIGGKLFRIADITIPMIVDDSATMVA